MPIAGKRGYLQKPVNGSSHTKTVADLLFVSVIF